MLTIIQVVLAVLLFYFLYFLVRDLIANKSNVGKGNLFVAGLIGFVTDFLDTLGVGSFATTTLLFNLTNYLESDKLLPGTLNAAHTIPVMIEAFIFIQVVDVEPLTLFSLIIASIAGSFIGSKTVSKLPEKKIQTFMGIALIITAVLMVMRQTGIMDLLGQGNEATGLSGFYLILGIAGNFIFGALMTVGVGLYAPCMAMVYMLGLNPLVAFPIMMASCAGLMPVASVEFLKADDYSRMATIGISVGGALGVIVAAFFVTSLNIDILVWIIVLVVIYTGASMLVKGTRKPLKQDV